MKEPQQKICILCSRLDLPGGIERAIVNTANLLQERGYHVSIIIADESDESFYPLREDISRHQLNVHFGITTSGNIISRKIRFFKDVQQLKNLLLSLNPTTIIGTDYSLSIVAYLAARKSNARIFAWEHHHFNWLKKSRFWNYLYQNIYPKLTAVICLNQAEKELYQKFGCTAVVIPNFIEQHFIATKNEKVILSIGWLSRVKGFDRIPEIAEKIFTQYPDWSWTIIGTGEEETALNKEIKKRDLQNNVFLEPPRSSDLKAIYSRASLYVMTSRFECFPMVLLEAMSYGIPAVAFDCPTGPSFIINHNEDGLLIENDDVDAMATALMELMADAEKRNQMGQAAYRNITRFSAEKIFQHWQYLLG